MIKRQVIADRVVHFYANIANSIKGITMKHFVEEGVMRNTIYEMFRRYEKTKNPTFYPKSGSPWS